VDVWFIGEGGTERRSVDDLEDLVDRTDGWVWVDIPTFDPAAEQLLAAVFDFHPRAVQDCAQRNHVPKIHAYADHLFLVVHSPQVSAGGGHVHYVELDQFVSTRYLVTLHGPLNPAVALETALRQTGEAARRLESGRLRPTSPYALSYAIVSSIVRHEEELTGTLARDVGLLEQRVMAGADEEEPENFLEELFKARHKLLTVRTMAAQTREVYGRLVRVASFVPQADVTRFDDLVDQYERLCGMADGQLAFLHGVTEYYRARTDTKMTIAAERLAVIAAVTLPITALSSVLGMNVIVNTSTHWVILVILLLTMIAMSLWLLRWARQHGWW
jgi:Mg2+ and Co2+ transporter CorA